MFDSALYIVHILLCVGIVALILVQHGKGADAGAAFGSGSSGTVFGAAGKANFLEKLTRIFVALFFVTSLTMMFYSGKIGSGNSESIVDKVGTLPTLEAVEKVEPNDSTVPAISNDGQEERKENSSL